jgi:hypothetical protein
MLTSTQCASFPLLISQFLYYRDPSTVCIVLIVSYIRPVFTSVHLQKFHALRCDLVPIGTCVHM